MSEVCVLGSANLDIVVPVARHPAAGETVMGADHQRVPGGKGANQAVAAARLGRSVTFVGRVGDDAAGRELRASLDGSGVDTSLLATDAEAPSGIALITVDDAGENAIVVSPGANGRVDESDIEQAENALAEASVVLLQLEIPIDTVTLAAEATEATVILNPAPAQALTTRLLEAVNVLVPNETELAFLAQANVPKSLDEAAQLATSLPIDHVIVTLGADGALVVVGDRAVHVPAPRVSPVDTTAAGDSFCGALAHSLVGGADLVAAAEFAVRVGAATTLRFGAQTSLPTIDEVDSLLGSAAP